MRKKTSCWALLLLFFLPFLQGCKVKLKVTQNAGIPAVEPRVKKDETIEWYSNNPTPGWILFQDDGICTNSNPDDFRVQKGHEASCKVQKFSKDEAYDICPTNPYPTSDQTPHQCPTHGTVTRPGGHPCNGCIIGSTSDDGSDNQSSSNPVVPPSSGPSTSSSSSEPK